MTVWKDCYPRNASCAVDQDAAFGQLPLDQLNELREILGDIFGFHVEQRVDDVGDGGIVLHVVHAHCCGDD